MAAHKYWQMLAFATPTPDTLELSAAHLYLGGARVDAGATLTASAAPSGALTNLSDSSTATGCYWSTGGAAVVLSWQFPAKQAVNGAMLGARTTSSRFPMAFMLRGGDVTTGAGPSPEYTDYLFFGGLRFVSAAMTALLVPKASGISFDPPIHTGDYHICGGNGTISGTVKKDADPTDLPLRRRVRLMREVDGRVVRETWSDAATGAYTFAGIDPAQTYTALAYDHEHNYRAVVADNLVPEVPA